MKIFHHIAIYLFLAVCCPITVLSETQYVYEWVDISSWGDNYRICTDQVLNDYNFSSGTPDCYDGNVGDRLTEGYLYWVQNGYEETDSDESSYCPGMQTNSGNSPNNPIPCYDGTEFEGTKECVVRPICEPCQTCESGSGGDSSNNECEVDVTVCSVRLSFRLGVNQKGRSIGSLIFHQDKPGAHIYSSKSLTFTPTHDGGGIILRNPDYSIRQIIADNRITQIMQTSPTSFTVGIYQRPENLVQDKDGFVDLTSQKARRFVTLSRPEGGEGFGSVDISDAFGGRSRDFQYRFNEEKQGWSHTLLGTDLVVLVYELVDAKSGDLTNIRESRDTSGKLLKVERRFLKQTDFGRYPIADEVEAGGEIQRTEYAYYDDKERDGAYYGRVKSVQNPDGSWKYYQFDIQGREQCIIEPWKDTPLTSNPHQAKATWHSTRHLHPGEDFYFPGAKVMEIKTTVLGVTVAKTYQVATVIAGEGRVEVIEKVVKVDAEYGDPSNQRTVVYYNQRREADPNSDKPGRRLNPDGSMTIHLREEGDYIDGQAGPGIFAARKGGSFIATTTMTVPVGAPDGLVGKTTKEIRVANSHDQELLSQNWVLASKTADGQNEWKLLNWTDYLYDERGRNTWVRNETGVLAEYRYNECCNKLEWQRDAEGVVTSTTYDVLNRVKARVVQAPNQAQVITHHRYDPLGNLIETTQVSGELELTTTATFDGFDRLVSQTGRDRLTTTHQYDLANRRTITILPTNATQVEDKYRDGRSKASHGTAVVGQYYDYGVDAATGYRFTDMVTGKMGGPRRTRSVIDPLERPIRTERPSTESGTILATEQMYDSKGRIASSRQSWRNLAKAARQDAANAPADVAEFAKNSDAIGAATLYFYDPVTGELLFSGLDMDQNGRLEPGGKDQITASETRFESFADRWFEVRRNWTYPRELQGKRHLRAETRRLVSNLGAKPTSFATGLVDHPKFAESVLVGETINLTPGKDGKMLPNISQNYRHRETSTSFGINRSAAGLSKINIVLAGNIISTTALDPKNPDTKIVTTHTFDAFDRRISSTDPRTGLTRTEYDPKTGRITAEIDPDDCRTTVEYYPAEQKHAGQVSAVLNQAGKAQRFAYNLRGQQVGIWGETQYPIAYEYNEYGERIGMRTFQLTPDGQPGLKENEGARTTWTYHEATGSLLKKSYADGTGPEYAYDKTGQLAERKWARSHVERVLNPLAKPNSPKPDGNPRITTSYNHDPITGSLTKATYSDGSEITYIYDDSQRLAKVTDSTGSREFTYNIKGQILTETVTVKQPGETPPLRYQITRTYYDEFCAQCAGGGTPDQPKQVTLTGLDGTDLNHQVSYEWDIRGQLAKVESPAGTFSYTYDPQNPALLASLQGPAHKVEYQYEPHRNLITSVKNLNTQKQSVISSYTYENDILGRRTSIVQRGSAFDMLQLHGQNTVQVAYNDRSEVTGYDITKLLDGAKQSGGVLPAAGQPRPDAQPKPAPQFAQTYAYDSIGNRTQFLTETGGEKIDELYESNALNQYTKLKRNEQDPENPTHDPDGNLLDDRRSHYTWNAENRMVKVEAKDGSYTVENAYDYQGRRTIQKHSTKTSVKTTIYLYDGWNLLAEIEDHQDLKDGENRSEASSLKPAASSLKSAKLYTWGRDLSGNLDGAGGVGGQLAILKKEKNHEDSLMFPCYDANGNIGQMISSKAEIKAAYQYDAFGQTVDMAGEKAEENEWRFSTKPLDAATGFYYYIFRDYIPETGRWNSRDPIEERGGVSLYAFVLNSTLSRIDRFGLSDSGGSGPTVSHVSLSKGKDGNYVMVLGYVGRGTDPAAVGDPNTDRPKSGVRKALEPIANLGEYDVDLYTWDAEAEAPITNQLSNLFNDAECEHMTVIIVGHSFGGHRAIRVTDWFDRKMKDFAEKIEEKKRPSYAVHLFSIDAVTIATGYLYEAPPAWTVGPQAESLGTWINFHASTPYMGAQGSAIEGANNILISTDHVNIDDLVAERISNEIKSILDALKNE